MFNNFFTTGKQSTGGQGVFDPFKNVFSAVKNYLSTPSKPRVSYTRPTIPGYNVNPYQIKMGDTFEKVAEANKMTVQQIQQANGGMLVPPPKGSFINIPSYVTSGAGIQPGTVPANFQSTRFNQTANSFGYDGKVNLTELQSNITKQLTNGQLPSAIPYQVTKTLLNPVTGKPFSDADFKAEGYVYNNQKQSWELPGANTVVQNQQQQTAQPATRAQQRAYNTSQGLMWDKHSGSWIPREEWIRRRRAAPEKAVKVTPTVATNSGGLPATTLDVQIGGG